MAHYAWSDIKAGTIEKPVTAARGDEVSKSKLGVSDADWQAMLDAGAVREKRFPAPQGFDGSAVDYVRQQLQEATAMSSLDEEEAASELARVEAGGSRIAEVASGLPSTESKEK